ncbi:MAG: J domain-containing protein [Leptospirales bacterium]|nr:J domain-containing protein [Leptospirales bacterium]
MNSNTADDAVASSYKKLAFKLHPDRNPGNEQKAHEAMINLNIAYSTLMSYRFQNPAKTGQEAEDPKTARQKRTYSEGARQKAHEQAIENDIAYKLFIKSRDAANDHIYKFFQYRLYNLARRDEVYNRGIFNRIVYAIRKSYHEIDSLENRADEPELLEHFRVFKKMIFDFYRASECLNVNDNYTNQYDVDAYRAYRRGDEKLTDAMKELFFDRHNRGFFKRHLAVINLMDAQLFLKNAMRSFPKSSWAVETRIKFEFTESLVNYFRLFFSE